MYNLSFSALKNEKVVTLLKWMEEVRQMWNYGEGLDGVV